VRTLVGYFPALHQGVLKLVEASGAELVIVLDETVLRDYRWYERDIRALPANAMAAALNGVCHGLGKFRVAMAGGCDNVRQAARPPHQIVMPDDEVTRNVAQELGLANLVEFRDVFLRWDRSKMAMRAVIDDLPTVGMADLPCPKAVELIKGEANKSSDFWYHLGAAVARDDIVLSKAYNEHVPNEQSPHMLGDPRIVFEAGQGIDVTTARHAEAGAISRAARHGLSTNGADLYASMFPCLNCAMHVVNAGIARVFFLEGYSMRDSAPYLKEKGVKVFRVVT
jgi:dCMP deaminase